MEIRKVQSEEWLSFVENTDNATFFHTPMWYNLWVNAGYYRGTSAYLFQVENEKVLLPLCFKGRKILLRRRYFSSPQGTYGGLVFQNPPQPNFKKEIEKWLSAKKVKIYKNPYLGENEQNNNCSYIITSNNTITLDSGQNWHPKHRYKLRRALKMEFEFHFSNTKNDWQEYYKIYKENIARRGKTSSNNYSQKLFDELYKLDESYRRLYLVLKDGAIQGGGIYFFDKTRIYHWHGCFTMQARELEAPIFLYYKMMEVLNNSNKQVLDLLPSGGHKGVDLFKRRFWGSDENFKAKQNL